MAATDYQSLAAYGKHFAAQPGVSIGQVLKLALLKNIAATVAPTVDTSNQALFSAANVAGYASMPGVSTGTVLELALLQIIAQNISGGGGGGSSALSSGNYAGGQPNFTPTSTPWLAIDTSNGTLWLYYNGAWN